MPAKPLSDGPKTAQLRILLTASERAELDIAAGSADVPTSTWARNLLLTAARTVAPKAKAKTARKPG